jgi:hypothetical protein
MYHKYGGGSNQECAGRLPSRLLRFVVKINKHDRGDLEPLLLRRPFNQPPAAAPIDQARLTINPMRPEFANESAAFSATLPKVWVFSPLRGRRPGR